MIPPTFQRLLAISVDWQNFGFVVFDGPGELLDWGTRNFRNGVNAVKIPLETKLLALIELVEPNAVVIREPTTEKRRAIVSKVTRCVRRGRIPVTIVGRKEILRAFPTSNQNKYQTAAAIARRYPELMSQLPSPRKCWQSEKPGITIFEAAAVALVYFGEESIPAS